MGFALLIGFFVCVISLLCAILLAAVDKWAEVKDGKKATVKEDEKFKFSDIKEFGLPYWLITISCVVVYCSIFPYTQIANGLMVDRLSFNPKTAGTLYSLPYFISAVASPVLGFIIDKFGKRALFSK